MLKPEISILVVGAGSMYCAESFANNVVVVEDLLATEITDAHINYIHVDGLEAPTMSYTISEMVLTTPFFFESPLQHFKDQRNPRVRSRIIDNAHTSGASIWKTLAEGRFASQKGDYLFFNLQIMNHMIQYLTNGKVVIYDKERDDVIRDDDGVEIYFDDKIAARNFLFTHQYTEEFAQKNFFFLPCNLPINLN